MKFIHDFIKFVFFLLQEQDLRVIAACRGNASELERTLQLFQNIALSCLIRVQFQTERPQADLRQSFLNDGQCGHFIRYKQHAFSLIQRVRNDIRNSLGFTGSRRSMQNEAATSGGRNDCRQLGSIRRKRQGQVFIDRCRVQFLGFREQVLRRIGEIPLRQAFDRFVLHQVLFTVLQVIPHDETAEGENAEECHRNDLKTGHTLNQRCDTCKNLCEIHALLVIRQFIQPIDFHSVILTQHLQQRHIHLRIFVAQFDRIHLLMDLTGDIDRE